MNSDPSAIVSAVQTAFLELLDLIGTAAEAEAPEKAQELKDEAQRTVLMLIAAIILADGNYNSTQKSFLSLLVNCDDLPGGEARYLNEYATKWEEASKRTPDFFAVALSYDLNRSTGITRGILRQIQIIGNNACASDGNISSAESKLVLEYIAFLEDKLDASSVPPIIVDITPMSMVLEQKPIRQFNRNA
jgi:hypothetical protein